MQKYKLLASSIFLIITLLVFGLQPAVTRAQGQLLDGKTFYGKIGEKGGKAYGNDEIIFSDGLFRSTDCDQYGFNSAKYTTVMDKNKINFSATTTSQTEGSIQWSGTLDGDNLTAIFFWHKKRKFWFDIKKNYWFKGKIKR